MQAKRVWVGLLGVEKTVIERVEFDQDAEVIVAAVRPARGQRRRCGQCGRRCAGFDRGEGRRRWPALDLGVVRAYLVADAPRVSCPEHGVVVAAVPWHATVPASPGRLRTPRRGWQSTPLAWRTVGRVITRVAKETRAGVDRFAGLTRIGIDEIAYKKGHRYLTVVVDHDSGRLVWAAPGHDAATLGRFFDILGPARCEQVRLVSADAAEWIAKVVAARRPAAVR